MEIKLSVRTVIEAILDEVKKQVNLSDEQLEDIYEIIEGWFGLEDLEDEINSYLKESKEE